MDMDFWASRVHSAKHFTAVQAAKLNSEHHLFLDESEGEDDARAYFPCPFCCIDIDVYGLSTHLQEEHCFDVRNAVCPVCAGNLGKDVTAHFMVQHAHSLKRRRKSQKSGFWSSSPSIFGKDLREISSLINVRGNAHESAPDPLLSPFFYTIPFTEQKGSPLDENSGADVSATSETKSAQPSMLDEEQDQDHEERRQKAAFVQQLMLSTIF
ncbi:Protein dehydration-induced 19, C-terminal [Dillenia turbinata]|uniref:Protein dehydration-induced 19, C-terminal n=1 Tax=Dillenia turbinata TaxID=194707 RepID=A0AAN8Z372_9MAGN